MANAPRHQAKHPSQHGQASTRGPRPRQRVAAWLAGRSLFLSLFLSLPLSLIAGACSPGNIGAPDEPGSAAGPSYTAAAVTPLGAYNVDLAQTSVSGISSGGYMAVQLHVAFSGIMRGIGVFAGGPYHCAGSSGSTSVASSTCMTGSPGIDVNSLIRITDSRAGSGALDPTANLGRQRIWLFSGTSDTIVRQTVMNSLEQYYLHYAPAANVFYKKDMNAGHAHITDTYGSACSTQGPPYINNCNYDGPGLLLQHIYGPLAPRNVGTLSGKLIQFDQSQFIANPKSKGFDQSGWAYVPADCAAGQPCKVHVAFHGCNQHQGAVGDKYYAHAGYNQWADTNRIIVLYPQATPSFTGPSNPSGCWDWWGYNNAATYDTKSGDQLAAIKAMLDRLASGAVTLAAPTGLAIKNVKDDSLELSWDPVSGAAGYDVYRAVAGSPMYIKINAGLLINTTYADTGLTAGTAYSYQVRAVTAAGAQSPASGAVGATTTGMPPALAAPTHLVASAVTATGVTLDWTASPGAAGYEVYRAATAGGMPSRVSSGTLTETRFADSGLAATTTYYYTVKARSAAGSLSAASSELAVTTAAAATCTTDNNWNHYRAGRATICVGHACALGSGQDMGLLTVAAITTLRQTGPGYYVVGTCP